MLTKLTDDKKKNLMIKFKTSVLSKSDIKAMIDSTYNDVDAGWFFKDRMFELNNIFTAQLSSLDKVHSLGFFTTLTSKFWSAFSAFLIIAGQVVSLETDYLIRESYTFIKSFDNALQGYLNSDRQFLEFPGHSVSLYDLPAKLGIVYTHLIDSIIEAFQDDDARFEYLLCPEPFDEERVHVTRLLSHRQKNEASEQDNDDTKIDLLIIEAPARLMFQPDKLLFALSHEVAHYVGRSHRVYCADKGINRNKTMYDLHKKALAFESVFQLKETFAKYCEDNQETAILEAILNCETRFADQSGQLLNFDPISSIDPQATFSQMEELLRQKFVNPISWKIDQLLYDEIGRANINGCHLSPRELDVFNDNKQKFVYNVKSSIIDLSEYIRYVIKEGTADALAIKLLGVGIDDYKRKMKEEQDHILGNKNLDRALKMREDLVCWACFDKRDSDQDSLGKHYDEDVKNFIKIVFDSYNAEKGSEVRNFYHQAIHKCEPKDMITAFLV